MKNLTPQHLQEWDRSAVHPGITALNVQTLEDNRDVSRFLNRPHRPGTIEGLTPGDRVKVKGCPETLTYAGSRLQWRYERRKGKQRPITWLTLETLDGGRRYYTADQLESIEALGPTAPGWVCTPLDPLNNWDRHTWGCYKPDRPQIDEEGKPRKYEHPARTPLSAFFLDVPLEVWAVIATRYGVPMGDPRVGFWQWVQAHPQVPLVLTEGAKKAAALLSAGYIAVGLPGVNAGYRSPEWGTRHLIPELVELGLNGRPVSICFDHETKPATVARVNGAVKALGWLLKEAGATLTVIALPGPEKGADDFIVTRGPEALHALPRLSLSNWEAVGLHALTYELALTVTRRYLGMDPEGNPAPLVIPDKGLVCVKSAKDTGKTTALIPLVLGAQRIGRRALVLTHRIQLGRDITEKTGLPWIEDIRDSEIGGMLGMGLCVDSLWRLNPQDYRGAILILDEVEQVFQHALNSSTCKEKRVPILKTLREILRVVLTTGGLVIIQDADLSDVTIDMIREWVPEAPAPWVLVNDWKPSEGTIHKWYSKPEAVLNKARQLIREGKRVLLVTDSQKPGSKWGTINFEASLLKDFPTLKGLRIDSETIADPTNPAYGCISGINQVVLGYDLTSCSPTVGTGVSLDVRGHFDAVLGLFTGSLPPDEVRQFLARLREPVTRYFYAPTQGRTQQNGVTSYRDLMKKARGMVGLGAALLDVDYDPDGPYDEVALRTWAKLTARTNLGMMGYRDSIIQGLISEGHTVTEGETPDPDLLALLKDSQTDIRDESVRADCEAVATAPELTAPEAQALESKRTHTPQERAQVRKHQITRRYGVPVTPELVQADGEGIYRKLKTHYFMTKDRAYLKARDSAHWQGHLERGAGKIHAPDVNFYGPVVKLLDYLDPLALIDPNREYKATDPDVIALTERWKKMNPRTQAVLGKLTKDPPPIKVLSKVFKALGYFLELAGKPGPRGKQVRGYRLAPEALDRVAIFTAWELKDRAHMEKTEMVSQLDTVVTSLYKKEIDPVTTTATDPPPVTTAPPKPEALTTLPPQPAPVSVPPVSEPPPQVPEGYRLARWGDLWGHSGPIPVLVPDRYGFRVDPDTPYRLTEAIPDPARGRFVTAEREWFPEFVYLPVGRVSA